jgi:thioredoxin 1
MKKLQILGTGCAKCTTLATNTEAAAKELGVAYELEKVTDLKQIMAFGVMTTPALVVDGVVKVAGKVPTPNEIKTLLTCLALLFGANLVGFATENVVTNVPAPTVASVKQLPKLLDLGATKCIPCKKMAPILDELKKEYAGKLEVEFIDVWKTPDEAKTYGINLIPTQIFYDDAGKELFRHEGFFGKADILAKWKELGVKFSNGN